jgi:hypothetical protein
VGVTREGEAMEKQKNRAGKDDERQVRGESGPPSATKNEQGEGHARDEDADRGIPKVGKHDAGRRGSWGGGLH